MALRARIVSLGRMEMNLQIPFLLLPEIFLPPFARGTPRAGSGEYFSLQAAEKNASGTSCIWRDLYGNRWTENPKACRSFRVLILFLRMKSSFLAVIFLRCTQGGEKPLHLKCCGT